MTKYKLPLKYAMRKNKNIKNSGYNKYFPQVDGQQTLSQRGFIDHIVSHSGTFNRATIEGVLTQVIECIPELVAQGTAVKIDSLGIFYPTIKGTGCMPEQLMDDSYNPALLIKGVRVRFRPDQTKLDNITSVAFRDRCALECAGVWTEAAVTRGDGSKEDALQLVPLDVFRRKQQAAGD